MIALRRHQDKDFLSNDIVHNNLIFFNLPILTISTFSSYCSDSESLNTISTFYSICFNDSNMGYSVNLGSLLEKYNGRTYVHIHNIMQ